MTTAVTCSAILGLLVFGLGFGVSMQRGATKTAAGFKDDPADPLYKWVRAHGNTVEFAPMMAIMILWLGTHQPSAWVEWTMIAGTVCRVLLPIGIITCATMEKANPLRFVGAVGTYITGLMLVAAMFLSA